MERLRPRPFVDTNVLFSGLYSERGAPAEILRRHARGPLTIVISPLVIEELVRAVRAKYPRVLGLLLEFLEGSPPVVCPSPTGEQVRFFTGLLDRADASILAAAIESESDCLITGNSRDFNSEVSVYARFPIFSPADYLASLET